MHTQTFVVTISSSKPIKELKNHVENRLHSMDKVEKVLAVPVIAQSETIANRFYTTSRADEAEPGSRPGA